ncbi:MAG TPA: glycosyltransferase family 2 protein [Candidatus Paceibacterota bacterium]
MPPLVSIIIVQYNNSEDTIRCLESVKELDYANFEVIIIDNSIEVNHKNNLQAFVSKNLSKAIFKIRDTTHNTGYAGGNNIGMHEALEQNTDYVFILNPDTTIEKNSLSDMITLAESDPKIGIVGANIDEGNRKINCGKIEWLKPELKHEQKTKHYYIAGAAMLIKKEVVKKIGMLDERYFLYFEDADFCTRAVRKGFKLAIANRAIVSHSVSSSTSKMGSAKLLHYHYRNAHLFNAKNGPWYIKLSLPFWSIFIIFKQLLKIVFAPQKRQISKAILAGVCDFYKGKFGQIST